ncbi:MAG: polyprenyl synthetase family protein, partial [Candidatus Margulisbacteria bacterium]|nr:polyprenyl synthetase family protein [Candidatus Margulisiibacteriota bacterium]
MLNVKTINLKLKDFLPKDSSIVSRAMRYSTLGGGKRFRAVLMMAVAEALGRPASKVMPAACAVEMIHAFTLIHDDLPAMDDSDYRRGKPSCHKVYGEDMAILAGDALCILAFEVLAKKTDKKVLTSVITELSVSLGVRGVVGGQELDLVSEGKKISLKKLRAIHA